MGKPISRRDLVRLSVAAFGAFGIAGVSGCGSRGSVSANASDVVLYDATVEIDDELVSSFVALSDLHLNLENEMNIDHFANALRDIATMKPKPATIVLVGDFTDSGEAAEYELARQIASDAGMDFDADFVKVMGNHEQYRSESDPKLSADDEKHVRFVEQAGVSSVYFDLELEGQHLICLGPDESLTGGWGMFNFSDAQMKWLEGLLDDDRRKGRVSYVFCHEPLFDTVRHTGKGSWSETHSLEDNDELASVLTGRSNVIFFSGHTHLYPDIAQPDENGPLYVNTSACGPAQLTPDVNDLSGFTGSFGWLVSVCEGKIVLNARDFLKHAWIDGLRYEMALRGNDDRGEHEEILEVNGVRLSVKEAGSGPDMVLIHGRTLSKKDMDPLFQRYRERYHVVSYDVRGHGKTESSGEFTLDDLSDDLVELISVCNLESPVVIGFSMGSYIALRTAERHPDLLSGIVLIGTRGGRASSPWPATDGVGRALESYDNMTDAPKAVLPALVLAGEYDSINPPAEGKLVADALPDASFEVVPGAEHQAYDGNPEFVFEQIDGFLRRIGLQ